LIGIAGANLSTSEERMARNARDSNIALQAAEAALRDAETDIVATRALSGATLFSATCDQTGGKGLCIPATSGTQRWEAYLEDASRSLSYGEQTGVPGFRPSTESGGVTGQPRYLVEAIPDAVGTSLRAGGGRYIYRITALGYGALSGTRVMLQEFFRP
jgi:type IV pilus assembly protein PilX